MSEAPEATETEQLAARLKRLERDEKILRVTLYLMVLLIGAVAALVALLLRPRPEAPSAGPPLKRLMVPEGGYLVADGLVIRDKKGKMRIWLGVDEKEESAKLRFLDKSGTVRITMRSSADRGSVALFDAKGKARAITSTDAAGASGFLLLDENETPKAALGTALTKDLSLLILDAKGFPQVRLPQAPPATPRR